jgi:hypothetical protein
MKDKILEIISKYKDLDCYYDFLEGNKEKALENKASLENIATEIADMGKAFTTWLIIEQEIFMGELSEKYIINDNIHVNGKRLETLDELFNYWYDNIREK